ncbi:MAG: PQQ-binding-like beta-propeller repeat protein [Planctomycetaceae bacterium]
MNTSADLQPLASGKPTPDTEQSPQNATARPSLRLWWPTLALVAYWIVVEGGHRIELAMFPRFISRMIALLSLMVFFLVWGFTRRHFTVRQRLAAFALIVGGMIAAGLAGDETTGLFGTAMLGVPIVLTFSTLWLWLTRSGSAGRELAGIGVASLLVFGTIALLRWDGLDGRQRTQLAWRWTPTAEERFLNELDETTNSTLRKDAAPIEVGDGDWASFRGGDRESVVAGVTLADWSISPPSELWRHRVGPGWSSLIAVGDVLITQEQRGDQEAVVCYRADGGSEVWAHTSDDRFEEALSGTGPRATPTAVDDKIVSYGAKGRLDCLDASTGNALWSRNVLEESGATVPMWGLSISPLIVDGLAVVFAGGKEDQGLLAFDLATGEPAWRTAGGTMTYSSPQVMAVDGVRQIVMQDEQALYGVDVADGRRLWSHPSPSAGSFQPMIQPHLVDGDRLIVGWGNGILCLQVRLEGESWQTAEQWTSNRLKPGFNDVIIDDSHIYGLDDGILCCVDVNDGKRLWKAGRYGFGQMLFLPEQRELLILTEKGEVVRVSATPEGHRELGRFKAIDGKTWNHPIIAHGRLVVRNGEEIACFELTNANVAAHSSD